MRCVVLADPDSWYLRDLQRAAQGQHEMVAGSFRQLSVELDQGRHTATTSGAERQQLVLNDFDAILVRAMPPGTLEQVVFRMDVLARLEAAGLVVLNPPKSLEAAVDKYLASAKLAAAGLPTPRTVVCQRADQAMQAWHGLGGDVVLKPLFGSEGRGLARLQDEALAWRAAKLLESQGAIFYLQQFVAHDGSDLRLLVIGQQVLGMRRRNPEDWRTNVSRGATTEPIEITAEMADLAVRSAAAIGAPLAGVDVLCDAAGQYYVIEVNAVPGWKALSSTCGVDVARRVVEYAAQCVERQLATRRSKLGSAAP